MDQFITWLENLATFKHSAGDAFTLWRIGQAKDGKPFLKLNPCEFTLNYVQLFNAMHDSIYQWKNSLSGLEWLHKAHGTPGFHLS